MLSIARPVSFSRQIPLAAVAFLGCLLLAAPAGAQTSGLTVTGLINELFLPPIPFNPTNSPLLSQEEYERRQADSIQGIAIGIGNALASFPLGASSAGFTYVVDPATKQRVLKSVTFGPMFVERALTNGRGVLNVGVSFQAASFDTLQSLDLEFGFPTQSQTGVYADGSGVGDSFRASLKVSTQVFVFSGSYGLTDRFDVGWAVPVASLSVRGQSIRDYNGGKEWDDNLLAGSGVPIRELYPGKTGSQVLTDQTVDASGIGDIVLRTKYRFGGPTRQLAMVSAELRLPTGDEENLLGTGKTTFKIVGGTSIRTAIGAAETSIHFNGGYATGGLTDDVNFAAGTDVALRENLTLSADFLVQNLRDSVTDVEQLVSFQGTLPPVFTQGYHPRLVTAQYGFWNRGSSTLVRAGVGAKYGFGNSWLLTGSVLFRLNDAGYQAKIVPFVGIEKTWSLPRK